MNKYEIKIVMALNKKYKTIDGFLIFDRDNDKNLIHHIKYEVRPSLLMHEAVKKAFCEDINFNGNICGDCAHMLDCAKVKDKEKRLFNAYPFITDGLEVILIDREISNNYKKAQEEYKKKENDPFFYLDDDKELKEKLKNTGIDVSLITVFGCENFVNEEGSTLIKKPKKQTRQHY